MFCDELKIKAIAGKGGNGCMSFRREKFVPKGGPDGGDGGHGGDVILQVNPQINTLYHLKHKKVYKANPGVPGKGKKMHGKNAEDLIIDVPKGTVVYNEDKSAIIADLDHEGDQIVIAKGGIGGKGNARFVSSVHQAPRFAENGEPGEEVKINLELKLVAEVGIIGLPSAGKSTLISVISNAKPKIAAYHFTTLVPNLGVVSLEQFGGNRENTFIVADIPGLIEGASEGRGLGHEFLRHVSRTKILVHLLDGTEENLVENFKTINQELEKFDEKLSRKEQLIAINKADMIEPAELKEKIKALEKASNKAKIYTISALTKTGLAQLLFDLSEKLSTLRTKEAEEEKEITEVEETIPTLKPHLEKVKFNIQKIEEKEGIKLFHIEGKRIEQLISMTDLNNREGLERVYHFMDKMGIQKAVEKAGAHYGDKIAINNKIIPYRQ